ncbi:hypothetical protein [Limnofasciculus baicalensis]|uniref:Uncharacterized protein n=1 Tax=Limnofasciculus baicalensis BBK-W-15 TaxID=2699891 RepID=A0AAE3KNA3_9CYAN|nr:hypothetical protein [Limnofasciculus baicalensis]MCP2728443.1 hypothetical protein [Limnofasciculus baicalensis BBK-W-15]
MKKAASNPGQLCLSIGKPLSLLLAEVHKSSRNPQLRKAAAQMQEALQIFAQANQTGLSKSVKAKVAIQEILTK